MAIFCDYRNSISGICLAGQGKFNIGGDQCTDCPVDTYSTGIDNECIPCRDGYNTYNETAAVKCQRK